MATLKYKTQNGYRSLPAMVVRKTNAENGFGIGTCSTSSGTALTVAITNYELVLNGFVMITFENDVPAGATLNINSKGAKAIYYKGAAITADTIKAGDTVTMAYDGTNYVVGSLGVEDGEIVVVRCSASDDASVAGKTVTINGTQYTLDSTGIVSAKVPFGTQYTVVAGVWSEDYITPETQTFTAGVVLREVTVVWVLEDVAIDLGLPSGVKWASKDIDVTQSNGFTASIYQYDCSFFDWGNVTGHNPNNGTFDYGFDETTYNNTSGAALTGNIPTNATYDAARANCGGDWRMPTDTEMQELIDNCDFINADGTVIPSTTVSKKTTVEGIVGCYLRSKINGNCIFFPWHGIGQNGTLNGRQDRYFSYLSTITNISNQSKSILFRDTTSYAIGGVGRWNGLTIRPVR